MSKYLSYSVIIISKDRPEILAETLRSVHCQSAPAEKVIVVVDKTQDFFADPAGNQKVQLLFHSGSLTMKRNFAVRHTTESSDLLLFVDDDIELHCDYAHRALIFFNAHTELIAASGTALADRWMPRTEAISLCQNATLRPDALRTVGAHWILYGCNMAIRRSIALKESFDETLPLYSYGEDYEISMRLRRHGQVGRMSSCLFVHLRAPQGRLTRNRYAYSVLANNWYFIKKGSVHVSLPMAYIRFAWLILKFSWREIKLGRAADRASSGLRGIFRALGDLAFGRLQPSRLNDV